MSKRNKIIVGIVALVGLFLVFSVVNGLFFSTTKDAHPPCDQLPTLDEVKTSLDNNEAFIQEIESQGTDIVVEAANICEKEPNKGLVVVSYHTKEDHDNISKLLTKREGFGVPIYLEKK